MAPRRSVARELFNLLSASPRPIYALDDRRRIVFCNPACCTWLGIDAEQLLGRSCDYHAASSDPAASLCPTPQGDSQSSWEAVIVHRRKGGTVTSRRVHFLALDDAASESSGWLAVVGDEQGEPTLEKPREATDAAELHRRLQVHFQSLRARYRLTSLVGESAAIRRVREQARLAIDGRTHVSIVGVKGSGREFLARTMHAAATKSAATPLAAPLLPLTCELLDTDMLQSTVLAFVERCRDLAAPSDGTILLLGVDQLSLENQLELWAFLQLPTFRLRMIATSRRGLNELAQSGDFHRDLALTLTALEISLPPLSTRRRDVPFLAQQFVEEFNAERGRQLAGFTVDALDRLCALPWTGDVAELAEIARAACERAEGPQIRISDLPRRVDLLVSAAEHPRPDEDERIQLDDFLAKIERELIERALRRAKGNKAHAARLLGVKRARLLRRLAQLELE